MTKFIVFVSNISYPLFSDVTQQALVVWEENKKSHWVLAASHMG